MSERQPPRIGRYPDAGMRIDLAMFSGYNDNPTQYAPKFDDFVTGITAEQAREAAHLLNQLAEYLESC